MKKFQQFKLQNQNKIEMKTMQSLFIALILCVSTSIAQSSNGYVFKVLANKGDSQLKSGSEMDWKPVKTGVVLNSGDELKVTDDAYVGLVHASGRTIELTTPGSVDVNELAAQLKGQSVSATSKYADFVLNKLADAENTRRDQLQVTGAVERKILDPNVIEVVMPLTSDVYESNASIQWKAVEGVSSYEVTLKNVFDEVVMDQVTADNSIEIDLANSELAGERLLILNVAVKGNDKVKSENYGIKRISDEERKEVEAKMNELTSGSSPSSLSEIMKASLYEQHNLLVDAAASYRRAIELSPQVDDFSEMYEAFIDRNNLK